MEGGGGVAEPARNNVPLGHKLASQNELLLRAKFFKGSLSLNRDPRSTLLRERYIAVKSHHLFSVRSPLYTFPTSDFDAD